MFSIILSSIKATMSYFAASFILVGFAALAYMVTCYFTSSNYRLVTQYGGTQFSAKVVKTDAPETVESETLPAQPFWAKRAVDALGGKDNIVEVVAVDGLSLQITLVDMAAVDSDWMYALNVFHVELKDRNVFVAICDTNVDAAAAAMNSAMQNA